MKKLFNLCGIVRQTKLKTYIPVIAVNVEQAVIMAQTFADDVYEEREPTEIGKDWG